MRTRPWALTAAGLGTGFAAMRAARRRAARWGTTTDEVHLLLPGDELITAPSSSTTRAVTIAAPAAEVWAWLVQIGQDRGGMYSYDALENLIGLHIHSADHIDERWQHLAVGDHVRLIPPGWLGIGPYELPVVRLDPGASIVLDLGPPWHGVWSFHVRSIDERHTRLVARSRTPTPAHRLARIAVAMTSFMDLVTFVMERRMLLGIKQRAERSPATAHRTGEESAA